MASNVRIDLTWYSRRTHDQLNIITVPYGFLPNWANVGDETARGFEATLGARLFNSRRASLDVNASYARNTNTLTSLGSATGYTSTYGSLVVGYPIDASFGRTIASVSDTVGGADSIAVPNEVTLTPVHYLGTLYAPNVYTVTPVMTLFGGQIHVSALFDRQTGGVQRDVFRQTCGFTGLCIAPYLKSTPLLEQATFLYGDQGPFIVSSDFTRWRELAITGELPTMLRQRLFVSHASVSFQVRNLMLWTNYKGPDPESIPGLGTTGTGSAYAGGTGIPQARSWTIRFDLTP